MPSPRLLLPMIIVIACALQAAAQDSLQADKPGLKDRIQKLLGKSDSIQSTAPTPENPADSLSEKAGRVRSQLDASKAKLSLKIDSLKKRDLPTANLQHQLDSISKIDPTKVVKEREAKLMSMQSTATGKIGEAQNGVNQKLQGLSNKLPNKNDTDLPIPGVKTPSVPGANIPSTGLPQSSLPGTGVSPNIPGAGSLPNTSMPQLPSSDLTKELNGISSAPAKEMGALKNISEVKSISAEAGDINGAAGKASGYAGDAAGIVKGDSASVAKLSGRLEKEAANAGELKNVTGQTQKLDEIKKIQGMASDPEALEKKAIEDAKKQAVNHFAGKEAVLQSAMDQVSKLKQKYSSLNSLSDIPKHIPNEMHGKPFIERIVPGISLQVMRTNNRFPIDINPWIGYRLTGHITLGGGWMTRISFHHFYYQGSSHVYGPRAFGEYRIGKGYWVRAELETISTDIPPSQLNPDPVTRRWVWGSFAGLKKRYKIYKSFYGNAQMLYNLNSLFDKHHINIYADPLTARIGFEFPIKKKNSAKVKVK